LQLGCAEVSIGDTIGAGTLTNTRELFAPLTKAVPAKYLAAHFHDTYGQALANLTVVLDHGVRTIDTAVAGLGGCPYAPGASGNVATEDVLQFCLGQGLVTNVNEKKVAAAGAWISAQLNRHNNSRAGKALLARRD
jgi:hydroxymethylglutaryl-CoA lyase